MIMTTDRGRTRVEITVNGSGFDQPLSGSIERTKEISSATLSFGNKSDRLFGYFQPTDIVEIYVGNNVVPDEPAFVGYPFEQSGKKRMELSLSGLLYPYTKRYMRVTDTDNVDGYEISAAIRKIMGMIPTPLSLKILGTNPTSYISDKSKLRFKEGVSLYDLLKKLRDSTSFFDAATQRDVGYVFFERNGVFHFRQIPIATEDNSAIDISYGNQIISVAPESTSVGLINRQTVIGKDVEATYDNLHRQHVDGIKEGEILNDNTLTTVADCFDKAKRLCEQALFPVIRTKISSPQLIDAIPYFTVVNIINSSDTFSGANLITSTEITFDTGLEVNCSLERTPPLFNSMLYKTVFTSPQAQGYRPMS